MVKPDSMSAYHLHPLKISLWKLSICTVVWTLVFFSGFSVGCCINKEVICHQLELGKKLANVSTECSCRHHGKSERTVTIYSHALLLRIHVIGAMVVCTFRLTFSQNIGKLFSKLKLVTDNFLFTHYNCQSGYSDSITYNCRLYHVELSKAARLTS